MIQRRSLLLAASGLATMASGGLGACGGGVGTGGTGDLSSNYTYGQISGFGSIIVNGVRYDDSAAQVLDDRGGSRSRDDLRLGMTVSIDSEAITQGTTGPQAKAGVVRFGTVLEAAISSIDTAGNQFVALGQTVRVQTTTVFDDSLVSGLAALSVGMPVEVHGYVDSTTQSIIATRIEGFTPAGTFKVRGLVTSLDATARSLHIGAADFDYSAAADVPASLAVGQLTTVYVQSVPGASGRWLVSRFNAGSISSPSGDHDSADVRGVVTAFTDTTNFVVNDVRVDARSASFPDGTGFTLGSRVKVEGRVEGGVLIAQKVEIDSDDRVRDEGIELHGSIESVDVGSQTFRVRGNTVFYGSSGIEFEDGTAADIAVGREVEVEGKLSADGTRVVAEKIKFE
jgi:Domain of unknown function (DUF5666)